MSTSALLTVTDIETFYGKIQALRGVSLDVHDGEIVTLIGANGAGKSTLMMTICGSPQARSGQIVIARVHDEVTVKRLRRRGATVELLPENPEFRPIVLDTRHDNLAIEGLAVGLIRCGRMG